MIQLDFFNCLVSKYFRSFCYIFLFRLPIYNYTNVVIVCVVAVFDSGKTFEYYYYLLKLYENAVMHQKLLLTFIPSAVVAILLKTYSIGIQ